MDLETVKAIWVRMALQIRDTIWSTTTIPENTRREILTTLSELPAEDYVSGAAPVDVGESFPAGKQSADK